MNLPAALDPALSASLLAALDTAAPSNEGGTRMLRAALDDPTVHAVVLIVHVGREPGASLLQVVRTPDPFAQWLGPSCI